MPAAIPVAVAALAGGVTISGSLAAGLTIGFSFGQALFAGGLALVGSLLQPKPKEPATSAFTAEARGRLHLVRSPVSARRVIYGETKVSGTLVFATSTGERNEFLHLVVAVAGHEVESIGAVYLNDESVGALDASGNATSGRFAGNLRVKKHLGTTDQAADADLVAEVAEWTPSHRLRGIAYVYLRLTANESAYPTGIPEPKFIVRGKRDIWDPRDDSVGWTDNAALCQLDYLRGTHGFNDAGNTDTATWVAAANACEESVDTPDGGTQARYTCNGSFDLDQAPLSVLEQLLTASGGRAVFRAGVWYGYVAEYHTPSVTLTEDDLRGPIRVRPRTRRSDLFNAVRGTYVEPGDGLYMPTDFPPVTNPLYETQDGGERIVTDIELPFTQDGVMAQRLAKIELERARQPIACDFPAKMTALDVAPWDVVSLTIAQLGWSAKTFRVVGWTLAEDGGVDLQLREEAAGVYQWAGGDATLIDFAPDTNLPSPFDVAAPSGLTLTEALYETREGGGVKVRGELAWLAAEDAFVTDYQVQHLPPGTSTWRDVVRTTELAVDLLDLQPGTHQVRVRALNRLGVPSAWVVLAQELQGLAAPPADITGLTLTVVGGVAIARFDQHPDLDVRMGGVIVCRHSSAQSGAQWNASRVIGEALTGNQTIMVLPALPGTYLFKARDSSGIYSLAAATVSTKAADAAAYTTLDTLTEGPAWAGTHSGTAAPDGTLKLDASAAMDDWGDVDGIDDWDSEGGVLAQGTYTFAAGMDFGTVKRVRVTADYLATVVNVLDQFDARTAPIDSWPSFDGDVEGDEATMRVEVRETDDDPTGTPTWSAWQRLDVADFEARALEFRVQLTSTDPAFNVQTDQITITAREAA